MDLGDRMIVFRARNRITQKELAEKCRVTAPTICNIERKKHIPTKLTEAKIIAVIGKE